MNRSSNIRMYQVYVTDQDGKDLPIGMRLSASKPLEDLAEAINIRVLKGIEKEWRNARVVPIEAINN